MSQMSEKTKNNSWVFSPFVHWSFKVLSLLLFIGLVVIWGFDCWSISNFNRDFVTLELKNSTRTKIPLYLVPNIDFTRLNLSYFELNLTNTHQNSTKTQLKSPLVVPNPANLSYLEQNLTKTHQNSTQTQLKSPLIVPNLGNLSHLEQNLTKTHQNSTETHIDSLLVSDSSNFNYFEKNLTKTHQNRKKTQIKSPLVASTPSNVTQIQPSVTVFSAEKSPNVINFTSQHQTDATLLPKIRSFDDLVWVSTELDPNYTSNLLSGWLTPGGEKCRERRTVAISIPKLDGIDKIELPTGEIHEFVFQALDETGDSVCLGGDYFELDLSGEKWKNRPPIKDFGNGSYSFSLQIHPDFEGDYTLTVILLFRHYEGLRFSPQRFVFDKEFRKIPIKFYKTSSRLKELKVCKKSDFSRNLWSGRWTRHGKNENCSIDNDGRYRCLDSRFPCQNPWCFGNLGVLESNGWTYSAHCSFRLFKRDEAWKCLNNRWIFFWGDSNHCDTIRNILHFILGVREIAVVPRRFDMNITNPRNKAQVVRITSVFNGHENETKNYHGLYSLEDVNYQEFLRGYFSGDTVPDTIVMNSGLHDGVFWRNIRRFTEGAERAAGFWADMVAAVRRRQVAPPEVVYRSTVATGGYARGLAFDTEKMEAYNGVFLDKLRRKKVVDHVVDHFDMTYAWHYDNRCNDGVHYGRAPAKARWRDGKIGHEYFVDLMLGHVLLNALCTR